MSGFSADIAQSTIYHEIPGKPWEIIGADMFSLLKTLSLHCKLS